MLNVSKTHQMNAQTKVVDKHVLVEAVNCLITSDNYTKMINEITEIIEHWDTHPMAYEGQLKPLNALIDVGLESRDAFENLVKLIESKRQLIPPLRRADYQRDLMRERRARFAKALALHAATQGPIKTPAERAKIEGEIRQRWAKARKEFIESRGKLTWKQRNAVANEFWEMIDRQLDDSLRELRRK